MITIAAEAIDDVTIPAEGSMFDVGAAHTTNFRCTGRSNNVCFIPIVFFYVICISQKVRLDACCRCNLICIRVLLVQAVVVRGGFLICRNFHRSHNVPVSRPARTESSVPMQTTWLVQSYIESSELTGAHSAASSCRSSPACNKGRSTVW